MVVTSYERLALRHNYTTTGTCEIVSKEGNGGVSCRMCVIKCETSLLGTILSTENSPSASSVAEGGNSVNRMIGTFGIIFFNSRAASIPFITGIEKSKMIRSG